VNSRSQLAHAGNESGLGEPLEALTCLSNNLPYRINFDSSITEVVHYFLAYRRVKNIIEVVLVRQLEQRLSGRRGRRGRFRQGTVIGVKAVSLNACRL